MLGACPLLLRCIKYWPPCHTDTGHTAVSREWIVSSKSIVPRGSMWGHNHTRAMLPKPIRMVIDWGSRWPTNCRILDWEVHDPAPIRTVRNKDIPLSWKLKELLTHKAASGAISLTVDVRGYFDVEWGQSSRNSKVAIESKRGRCQCNARYLCQSLKAAAIVRGETKI